MVLREKFRTMNAYIKKTRMSSNQQPNYNFRNQKKNKLNPKLVGGRK